MVFDLFHLKNDYFWPMMKTPYIIADNAIPYLQGILEPYAHIDYLSPRQIDAEAVRHADILIVRTRTQCNKQLLAHSPCRYIATATIGYDHIDTHYCREMGITWANSPGCNALSVAQYILSSLLTWSFHTGKPLHECTLGVVGVGHVGQRVAHYGELLGMQVLRNDPPRQEAEGDEGFVSLDTICRKADIITFHTPLTRHGKYPTFHLADDNLFGSLRRRPLIINSARGEIIDGEALKRAVSRQAIAGFILDCWENEPHIDAQLLQQAFIATPHIAGYSADGKATATRMVVQAVSQWMGVEIPVEKIAPLPPMQPVIDLSATDTPLYTAVRHSYNPLTDDDRLRQSPHTFEAQRSHYPLRREFSAYSIQGVSLSSIELLHKLGFNIA